MALTNWSNLTNSTNLTHLTHWTNLTAIHPSIYFYIHLSVNKTTSERWKWPKTLDFWHFLLANVLRATTACTFWTSQLPKVLRSWWGGGSVIPTILAQLYQLPFVPTDLAQFYPQCSLGWGGLGHGVGRVTVHFYLNTMLIGVGWGGAWGGACYRSLLLEHNADWGGVGWGMGWGVLPFTSTWTQCSLGWGGVGPRVQAIHFPRVQASQISRVQPMHRPTLTSNDITLSLLIIKL